MKEETNLGIQGKVLYGVCFVLLFLIGYFWKKKNDFELEAKGVNLDKVLKKSIPDYERRLAVLKESETLHRNRFLEYEQEQDKIARIRRETDNIENTFTLQKDVVYKGIKEFRENVLFFIWQDIFSNKVRYTGRAIGEFDRERLPKLVVKALELKGAFDEGEYPYGVIEIINQSLDMPRVPFELVRRKLSKGWNELRFTGSYNYVVKSKYRSKYDDSWLRRR